MHNIFYTILVICNIYKIYKIAREQMVFGKTDVTYLKTYLPTYTIHNYFNSQPYWFFRVLLTSLKYLQYTCVSYIT